MIFLNKLSNYEVKTLLIECRAELQDIKHILSKNIKFNKQTKYLTNYSIIKACSTIEFCYKKTIADYFDHNQNIFIKNFISNKLRHDSSNPSIAIINNSLKSFGDQYNDEFNKRIKCNRKIYEKSLTKLREARNKVAHGENITVTVDFVITHFQISREIIIHLDNSLKDSNSLTNPPYFLDCIKS
jgi:hypothetical protein